LKITGRTVAVARAEAGEAGHEGHLQIDGTIRSNCGTGLEEHVAVSLMESSPAVAVRMAPLWVGAAPAIIAPERLVEDLIGVPVGQGCAGRVPAFAKGLHFPGVRPAPS